MHKGVLNIRIIAQYEFKNHNLLEAPIYSYLHNGYQKLGKIDKILSYFMKDFGKSITELA